MNTYPRNPLPNYENAIIEDSKLTEYALNPDIACGLNHRKQENIKLVYSKVLLDST
jgi:hypothetical protein